MSENILKGNLIIGFIRFQISIIAFVEISRPLPHAVKTIKDFLESCIGRNINFMHLLHEPIIFLYANFYSI